MAGFNPYTVITLSAGRISQTLLFFVMLVLMGGCSRPVAVVNGKEISKKEYQQYLKDKTLAMDKKATTTGDVIIKNVVLDSLIEKYLVLEEAKKQGLTVSDAEIKRETEKFRTSFKTEDEYRTYLRQRDMKEEDVTERLRSTLITNKFIFSLVDFQSVSFEDIQGRYAMQKPLLNEPMLKVSIIESLDPGNADRILAQIKKTSFEETVETLSTRGGDAVAATKPQWVNTDSFSGELSKILGGMRPQQYVGPIQRNNSWYIIKLYERREKRYKSFDEAKQEIMFQILHEKRLAAMKEWIKKKKETSSITVYAKRL